MNKSIRHFELGHKILLVWLSAILALSLLGKLTGLRLLLILNKILSAPLLALLGLLSLVLLFHLLRLISTKTIADEDY